MSRLIIQDSFQPLTSLSYLFYSIMSLIGYISILITIQILLILIIPNLILNKFTNYPIGISNLPKSLIFNHNIIHHPPI